MCLVIPPAIVIGATMLATAASTTAAIMSGVAQRKASEANRQLMDQQSAQVRAAGEVEAEKAAYQGSQVIGKAKASAGASGTDVQSPTVLDVLSDARMMSTWNREAMRRNTEFSALAYEQQGKIAEMKGKAALTSSLLNAGGAAIGGLSSGYAQAYQMGMFPQMSKGGDVMGLPGTNIEDYTGLGDLGTNVGDYTRLPS